jgi:hypothetical protein
MENNTPTAVELLFEKAENYGKTTIELAKLNVIDTLAEVVSSLATQLALSIVVAMFLLTVNIGIALWVGELLGKTYYGFFVVAGAYTFLAILLYTFRNQWIKLPISNTIISKMLKTRI